MSDSLGPEGSYYEAKRREEEDQQQRETAQQANEWQAKLNGLYPIIITGIYLVLGGVFGLWHPGWLVFLTIPLYYMHPDTPLERWCNPVMITLIYLVLGFFFKLWHPGWLIFLAIPAGAILNRK